ncbi:MAG: hypothetical protein AMJ65_09085 [Phycisphaerae bacterium SG8_4]|nr:MAG: hypothetical protein AMJ65_09085 [Phycisphaerae bacterium SG8_4]
MLLAVVTATASGQVRVSAQVDTSRDIYVGENFAYYVVIEGSDKPGQVDLEPLRQYDPQSTGNRRQSSTNIINSKVTTTTTMIMTYSLRAGEAGLMRLPSLSVVVDGKTYRTNPVAVNVTKPGTTDQLDIEMELSQQRCFVGQAVLLTIKFYFSANTKSPQFNIPVLDSDAFYFENPDVLNQEVQEHDFGNGVTILYSQHQVTRAGRPTNLLLLRKILIPKSSGSMRIEPTTATADVAVARSNSFFGSQFRYKRFMVTSEPVELTVLPLPEEGKPAEFYGLVGQYTIQASASPTDVSVGDPVTLSIKIGGGEYLKPVRWPALEQVPELAANFKIPTQKASPTIVDGFKVFTQTIRANNDNVTEIPSIPLAYFDAETGKYAIAKTEPIKLDVAPTKILTNADLEGADLAPVNREVEAIKKGLSANYEDLDVLEDMSFSPLAALAHPGYAVLCGAPLLAFASSLLIRLSGRTSPEKAAAKRRRQACGKALGQLKRIASANPERQSELLVGAMKQYIGERFDKTAGSLTGDDCYDIIVASTDDAPAADKFREAVTSFEAARYASLEVNITSERVKEVIELIRRIEKNCR